MPQWIIWCLQTWALILRPLAAGGGATPPGSPGPQAIPSSVSADGGDDEDDDVQLLGPEMQWPEMHGSNDPDVDARTAEPEQQRDREVQIADFVVDVCGSSSGADAHERPVPKPELAEPYPEIAGPEPDIDDQINQRIDAAIKADASLRDRVVANIKAYETAHASDDREPIFEIPEPEIDGPEHEC